MTSKTKNKGPIVDPALCRCCSSIKKCRLLTAEYEWMDQKEVYSEMFMDCFGLLLSNLDGEEKECCICATCVVRLRDALAFKQQVLQCEAVFLDSKLEADTLEEKDECETDTKVEVEVKVEPKLDVDSDDGMDDRDDLLPLNTMVLHADTQEDDDVKVKLETAKAEEIEQKLLMKLEEDKQKELEENKKTTKATRSKTTKTKATKVKRLKKESKRMKDMTDKLEQLDKMLKKSSKSSRKTKEPKKEKQSKKKSLQFDDMAYKNSVAIVLNSYICPFLNRISMYYCYYCKDQFTNPIELREHTMTHDPKKDFEAMMENKKIPKMDITRIDCRLCNEKINDVDTLKRHLSVTHKKTIYQVSNEFLKFRLTLDNLTCVECGSSFPYFDMLTKHMIDHFGSHICDVCGACFLEQTSLRTHIRTHSKVETNFPCEICGKNLKSKYSRYLHIATVHEKKATINCYKCESAFLSYALRNRHLIEVHGDKRTFACKLCDKVYNRRKSLMEHHRRIHLKVYKHQCELCDQRFYLPSRLKEHMATHTGERNFRARKPTQGSNLDLPCDESELKSRLYRAIEVSTLI